MRHVHDLPGIAEDGKANELLRLGAALLHSLSMESMTGFGAGAISFDGPAGPATLRVEIRSVNHRHIDVRIHADEELQDFTASIDDLVRKRGQRGRFDVRLVTDARIAPPPLLDSARARSAYAELCTLRDELSPGEAVPLSLLSSVPGLFEAGAPTDAEALGKAIRQAANAAFDDLLAMRSVEGSALRADIAKHLEHTEHTCDSLEAELPKLVERSRERLRTRLHALLDERFTQVNETRLEQEVAILADKGDVAEELSRLRSHMQQFGEIAATAGPKGRKLDFLLQEMGREANTIGSKIRDADITIRVVELKSCLERIREQVQNVA